MVSLLQRVRSQCEATPAASAVREGEHVLSYRELDIASDAVAARLAALGVGHNDVVAIGQGRSRWLPVSIVGVLKAGAGYAPIDAGYPRERRELMLADCQAKVLLTDHAHVATFADADATVVQVEDIVAAPGLAAPWALVADDDFERLAYVIFTSGSTGRPKGVAMPHRPLANLITWQLTEARVEAGARTLQFAPVSFDVHFQEMFATWAHGGELVMIADEVRRDAEALSQFLVTQAIARVFLPFVALQGLADASVRAQRFPAMLRDVITAGEQLQTTPQLRAWFGRMPQARLFNHYGPSETHVVTSFALPADVADWAPLPSIGAPIAGVSVHVLDESRQAVAEGAEGELYFGGVAPALGYLGRAELSAERFVPEPGPRRPGAPGLMYKTGDLGRRLPDGNYEYLGRNDTQVKIRGFRVELGEIEVVLSDHPDVVAACVGVREARPGVPRLVGWVVLQAAAMCQEEQLRAYLAGRLAEYLVPSVLMVVPDLPRTPSGKIDRLALPSPFSQHAAANASSVTELARGEALPREVVALVRHATGLELAYADAQTTPLRDLGLDSMMLTQLAFALRERFTVAAGLRDLLAAPTTLRSIVEWLDAALPPGPLPPAPPLVMSQPLVLGPHQAFAMQYTAASLSAVGVVIVPPLAFELVRTHRTVRSLARALAAAGLSVLVLDVYGNGDAAGELADARVATWQADVLAAVAHLRRTAGVTTVHLVGVRLGALLAASVRDEARAASLLAVDPVFDGAAWLAELDRLHAEMVVDAWRFNVPRATVSEPDERIGELWRAPLRGDLQALSYATRGGDVVVCSHAQDLPGGQARTVRTDDAPAWGELRQLEQIVALPQAVAAICDALVASAAGGRP